MTLRRVASLDGALVVAAIAALASYSHMRGLAVRYGRPELIADLLPVSVDGMMVVLWMCIGCGRPWPCPPRRRQLLDAYADSPTALALVLSSALMDACRDLPNVRPGELYQQVVGWLPSFRNSGRAW